MNINQAIEILEKEEGDTFWGSEKDWKVAIKLGKEALILLNALHLLFSDTDFFDPLAGETKNPIKKAKDDNSN